GRRGAGPLRGLSFQGPSPSGRGVGVRVRASHEVHFGPVPSSAPSGHLLTHKGTPYSRRREKDSLPFGVSSCPLPTTSASSKSAPATACKTRRRCCRPR